MTTQRALLTAADLWTISHNHPEHRYELLDGVLVEMPPTNGIHGSVEARFARFFGVYTDEHGGDVWTGEPGFFLRRDPDRVRAPDVCFFVAGRVPSDQEISYGYATTLPDLVVEVVSPSDTAAGVQEKVAEWLAAGVRLVLVAYPTTRMVVAHRSLTDIRTYTDADILDAGPVLPDFACPVAQLFRGA